MILFFLSSGLFLGWSLGGNDAANVFGTAVGTKMIKFRTAALIASIFLILGAVISGAGASHTLGKLGAVSAIGGAFMVAFAAAFTVFMMTRLQLPVSTSQAIVGAIIGWNLFSHTQTDYNSLVKIVSTWVMSPILAAVFSALLYILLKLILKKWKLSIFRLDSYTRIALIVVGAFGAYSLGANNIANVMGVFVPVSPFNDINIGNFFTVTGIQQLFFLGAIAISVGVFTYSFKVMKTVGAGVVKLTPQSALVVVLAESLVLFLFASSSVHDFLVSHNLPAFPLVPVSSSQLVIGAILGIGFVQGGRNINFKVLGRIASGWVTTPILSALIAFIALFFLQNTFNIEVYKPKQVQPEKTLISSDSTYLKKSLLKKEKYTAKYLKREFAVKKTELKTHKNTYPDCEILRIIVIAVSTGELRPI